MNLEALVRSARALGASDLHVEAAQPVVFRVRGDLQRTGDSPQAAETEAAARSLLGESHWLEFSERRSHNLSRSLGGVRCRINVFYTSRGVAFAIRLLAEASPTIETLNLLPALREAVAKQHGLVIVGGATGSGKSSTLAALVREVNLTSPRHVITLEDPIEYALDSEIAFVRQREIGTHTPSFEQGLIDALREDADVLVVGEMRDPAVVQLTLKFVETGHLVLTTVQSSSTIEALQRVTSSFPPERQPSVRAQLADALIVVIAQRLVYRSDLRMRVPECEILTVSPAVRDVVRHGQLAELVSALEAGERDGMYTWERYQAWMTSRTEWHEPAPIPLAFAEPAIREQHVDPPAPASPVPPAKQAIPDSDVITLEPAEENLADLVSRLRPTGLR